MWEEGKAREERCRTEEVAGEEVEEDRCEGGDVTKVRGRVSDGRREGEGRAREVREERGDSDKGARPLILLLSKHVLLDQHILLFHDILLYQHAFQCKHVILINMVFYQHLLLFNLVLKP